MKKVLRPLLDAAFYVVVFILVQLLVTLVAQRLCPDLLTNSLALIVVSAVSSLLTIALFAGCRWYEPSRRYLQSRPWGAMVWTALLTLGTVIPSEWLLEVSGLDMPDGQQAMLMRLMSHPAGFAVVAVLVPLAEEVVFRGALLRRLLTLTGPQYRWVAILLSALAFGACHGNWAQFAHASLVGLLLGWMYWRTGSILPGLVFHFVNNMVAYLVVTLMPALPDSNLLELCQGDQRLILLYVGCSLCILLPSLFQLSLRLHRPE